MSKASFKLSVLTHEKELFAGKAVSLVARAQDGELGILANHAPLLTLLGKGRIRFTTAEGENREFKTEQGFLKASNNQVTALL